MLQEHKPVCSLEWSYAESHQGVPASASRTSMKPQTKVESPLTTCISGFCTSPHVPRTMPRAGSPKGGGAAPPPPACPHSQGWESARLGDHWGSRGPAQRTVPRQRVVCVLCPVSCTVVLPSVGCLPGLPSDAHAGRGPGHTGEVRVEKPLLEEWPFPGRQEVMSLLNRKHGL